MDLFGQEDGSITLKEPIDVNELQDPQKGSMFEIDQDSVRPDEASNTYFKGEDVYKHLMPLDDEVALDVENGVEPFDAMKRHMEDISGDGGVMKKIIKPGAGPIVPDGALVRIKYNAWKELEDEPFDSCYLRNEVEKFRVGKDGTVRGMHVSLATMKKGEKSRFLFAPEYYYGKMGCGDRIPPDCTVLFEIELLSFVEQEGIDDYYSMTEEERRNVTFEFVSKVSKAEREEGNQLFTAELYHRAIGKYRRAARIFEDYHLKNEEEEKQQKRLLIRIYLNMAICHHKMRENGQTIRLCEQILDMDEKSRKDHIKALYFKAKAKHSLGDFDDARKIFRQAQSMQPQNKDINEALQKLEQDVKRFDYEYKEICKKMVSLGPSMTDSGEGKADDSPPKETERSKHLSDFEKAVWEQMEAFRDDPELSEIPFPDGQLTVQEVACIVQVAGQLEMKIQRRGTGNNTHMVVMKKTSPLTKNS